MNKSLHFQKHQVANPAFQTDFLSKETALPTFETKLSEVGLFPLKATQLETLQLNLGKMCNQTCTHCHVDAGPDRKEIMTQETMLDILNIIKNNNFNLIDLTGGAPEMNPHFRWFVEQIREINPTIRIIVRSNLTIILANPKYNDLPHFFKKHGIEVVSSLPSTDSIKTDSQRGKGVFEQSIKALQLLNEVGYGKAESSLHLSLVYNPSDAFLAMPQSVLEKDFKKSLRNNHQIDFNKLLTINNLPISRFLNHLLITNQYEAYLQQLVDAFNPQAAENVMCRTMLSVSWDGYLYDCDFNQMLEMKVASSAQHISQFNAEELRQRTIKINQHCFGCTAGGGSSCGGETVKLKDTYLETTKDVYKKAAETPDVGLCCTTTPVWSLPGLEMPKIMLEMNYGCGSTVNPRDLVNSPTILYVGVGGGMEVFQFSYFSRKKGGVIGVDVVDEMLHACQKNLQEAENKNNWFKKEFIDLRKGDALHLPVEDASIDVAAQNCLFNIFKTEDLKKALNEMYRVLKPNGRLVMSDPVCEVPLSEELRNDERLRALCLTGSLPLNDYIKMITDVGFGTIEVRAKRPYRILSPNHYDTDKLIYIESVEICAIKDPMPADGPCIFTGRSAIYYGKEDYFDDKAGHFMLQNQPLAVCDKTAAALKTLNRNDIFVSESTWFYDGGGCC